LSLFPSLLSLFSSSSLTSAVRFRFLLLLLLLLPPLLLLLLLLLPLLLELELLVPPLLTAPPAPAPPTSNSAWSSFAKAAPASVMKPRCRSFLMPAFAPPRQSTSFTVFAAL
jgi:hypothetical protein